MATKLDSRSVIQAKTMSRYREVIVAPVVSEKSYAGYDDGIYTFVVDPSANKIEIKQAVETIFNVKVADVRTHNRNGKRKRNRKTGTYGSRASKKIAVVTLKPGNTIEVLGV